MLRASAAPFGGVELDARRPPPVARADDAAPPARAGRAARAALPRPQDPRPASPTTTERPARSPAARRRSRRCPRRRAARRRRGRRRRARRRRRAARPRRRPTLERPRAGRLRRLRDQRRDAARAGHVKAPPRDVAERLGGRRCARGSATQLERVEVAGPGLPEPRSWPTPGTARALAPRPGRGRALRRGRRGAPSSGSTSSSSRPTRPGRCTSATRATPPTATRSRGCSSSTATTSRASSTSTTSARRSASFGESIQARARGEEVAGGRLPGRLRRRAGRLRSTAPPTLELDELGRRGGRARCSSRSAASLRALRRRDFDVWFSRALAARGRRRTPRVEQALALLEERGADLPLRRRAVAAHDRVRRRQGPRARALDRRAHLLRLRHRLPARQARARLRPPADACCGADHHGYIARMKAAYEALGGDPRPARAADHAVRPPRRRRRALVDVQARGEFVTLDDLVAEIGVDAARWYLLGALARHDDRPRPRPRASASRPRTPSTTCSTRTRGSPRCWRKAGEAAGRCGAGGAGVRRQRARAAAERALIKQAAGVPGEVAEAAERRAPHRIAPTRSSSRRTSRPSTATAGSSAPSPSSSSRSGSRCASRRSARSRARWTCSGVSAPEEM